MANWDLGIISPTTPFSLALQFYSVATTKDYNILPSNPVPPPTVNWNLNIISPTTSLSNSAKWVTVATTQPAVVKPSNPVPPQQNFPSGANQPTYRGWLWGRRPVTGVQYPRG